MAFFVHSLRHGAARTFNIAKKFRKLKPQKLHIYSSQPLVGKTTKLPTQFILSPTIRRCLTQLIFIFLIMIFEFSFFFILICLIFFIYPIYLSYTFIYFYSFIYYFPPSVVRFQILQTPLPSEEGAANKRQMSSRGYSDYRHVQTAVFAVLILKQRDKIHTAITMRTKAMN